MYHIFLTHSSVNGHLGCFCVLAIVNSATMNTGAHVSFWIMVFSEYMPSSGFAGLYGRFIPSFLRNRHTFLHNGCISLHSHQQCGRVPFSLYSLQHLQGRKGDTDVEKRLVDTVGEGESEKSGESSINIHTLPDVRWITGEKFLYSTESPV